MPGANVIREYFVSAAVSLMSALQKQRDVFADNEDSDKVRKYRIQSKIDKDALLFNGDVIKGASYLTRRNNPHAQTKITKEEHEESFQYLESMGFGSIKTSTRNNKTCYIHKKKCLSEIATNLDALDKWPKTVSFKEHEVKRTLDQSTNAEVTVD